MKKLKVIVYTTLYRAGGDKFKRVAETMARSIDNSESRVICQAVESKEDLKQLFSSLASTNRQMDEFHFVGHSGMYGPMFGSVEYPEQFSPHELKTMSIPFAQSAEASFHCCRSARWFAPYFARVQKVKTRGYHWYTTFSSREDRYKLPAFKKPNQDLYCFGCPGNKSHGPVASLKKLLGLMPAEQLKEFDLESEEVDTSYNEVADLYAKTFSDIKVRRDEFSWLMKHFPKRDGIKMLDIGCGNGALLRALHTEIAHGVGVDVSERLLDHAQKASVNFQNLEFEQINGPQLPFEEDSFDVVVSLLSFRYLDWDPVMTEIERVLKREGKLIIIDMVTAPVSFYEIPLFIKSKVKNYIDRLKNPEFHKHLSMLVGHPGWKRMLTYNPIRSQHEMKWYLESRFPNRKVEVINVGYHSRILAFQSGDMTNTANIKLSYP